MADPLEMFVEFASATCSLTYTLNRPVIDAGPEDFADKRLAERHPLAGRLMVVDGVRRVVLTAGVVQVICDPHEDLEEVAARVELVLRHYFG